MENVKISIIIPTLNNVNYLKFNVDAIRKHTTCPYEILVHANEISPEMLQYTETANFDIFTYSEDNLGVAIPCNSLVERATGNVIFYCGDDLYVTPEWDKVVDKLNSKIFYQYLTVCMFEPLYSNSCMNSPMNYGRTPEDFQEEKFLTEWKEKRRIKEDIISPWGPVIVTKELWDRVGGFDQGYFPGFCTDSDFIAKIYSEVMKEETQYEFRGVADIGMYHFQCISTDRLLDNSSLRAQAKKMFIHKWGIEPMELYKSLHMGQKI